MRLTYALFEEVYAMFDESFPNEIKITKQELKQNLFSGNFQMFLLMSKDEIIGVFVYHPIISIRHCVFIEYIFIKKAYQSKGYGKHFIQECLSRLIKDYTHIFLDCQPHLISYYEKLGFVNMNQRKINVHNIELYLMAQHECSEFLDVWYSL
jgi:GNAT superfamily N-acetyltransferase